MSSQENANKQKQETPTLDEMRKILSKHVMNRFEKFIIFTQMKNDFGCLISNCLFIRYDQVLDGIYESNLWDFRNILHQSKRFNDQLDHVTNNFDTIKNDPDTYFKLLETAPMW